MQAYKPIVPFPQRLQKAKIEEKLCRFLEMFEKVEINILFVEALAQMPNYTKCFKDILSKKKKFAKKNEWRT